MKAPNRRQGEVGASMVLRSPARARGLGLVELLVGMTISLLVILGATSIYLATRDTQRTIDENNAAHEAGVFALRLIGRELMNAGFYPAIRIENPALANVPSEYVNITGLAAYATGLFGCEGAVINVQTGTCPAAVAGAPDSVVVSYFTNDAFGTAVGQRADCEGADVGGATALFNGARVGTVPAGQPPALPLFVANHYTLVGGPNNRASINETVTTEGRDASTFSLGCNGNGSGAFTWSPIVAGLEDLQITYGVFSDVSRQPQRYFRADEVAALPIVNIDGVDMPAWRRVSAVRVCVIARSVQPAVALANATASPRTYQNCDGADIAQTAADRSLRKTYVQVFGLRNRQSTTF